jgi:eukaryotic-like serine/threonine-protein kinase
MQLWTEYEGVTIDGAFPLQKLLLPEGRSAFFSTSNAKGEPTFVRLIECHFDEDEILARWHSLAVLNHPNFLKLERFGRIELDGGTVAYAVFEKVDANLAAVLDEGHLTVKDVAQLASSMVAALDVLHTHGFVHEQVEPRNIFAVGEQVKLRSDCIREAPEGEDGRARKQRDVHDLAMVILQALTQRQSLEGIPDYAVPSPFNQIIRNGLDGMWGLTEIRAALEGKSVLGQRIEPKEFEPTPVTDPAKPVAPVVSVASAATDGEQETASSAAGPSMRTEAQLSLPLDGKDQVRDLDEDWGARQRTGRRTGFGAEYAGELRSRHAWDDARDGERSFSLRSRWLAVAAIVALVVLLLVGIMHAWKMHGNKGAQAADQVAQPAATAAKEVSSSTAVKPASTATKPAAGSSSGSLPAFSAGSRAVWRVIAFTYDRRADAEKKVASLASRHPELQPAVFSAHGGAPYLVSIGGAMSRDAAYALARRARPLGLPRDTYAQNYSH